MVRRVIEDTPDRKTLADTDAALAAIGWRRTPESHAQAFGPGYLWVGTQGQPNNAAAATAGDLGFNYFKPGQRRGPDGRWIDEGGGGISATSPAGKLNLGPVTDVLNDKPQELPKETQVASDSLEQVLLASAKVVMEADNAKAEEAKAAAAPATSMPKHPNIIVNGGPDIAGPFKGEKASREFLAKKLNDDSKFTVFEKLYFPAVFGAEGGIRPDGPNGPAGGISYSALSDANYAYNLMKLDQRLVKIAGNDVTVYWPTEDDITTYYRAYIQHALQKINNPKGIDAIEDIGARAVFIDALKPPAPNPG